MENCLEFLDDVVQFGRTIGELKGFGAKLFDPVFQPMGHWLRGLHERIGRVSRVMVRFDTVHTVFWSLSVPGWR